MAHYFSVFLAGLLTLAFLASPSAGDDSNVLLTGDVLQTDSGLTTATASFVMQDDCNLVLYNGRRGFISNTHGLGANCTLTLNDFGQFVIRRASGSPVWSSRLNGYQKSGKYAAVIRPDGEVAIYGPMLWSTSLYAFAPSAVLSASGDASHASSATSTTDQQKDAFQNVLFSGQILYGGAELATRDYTFVMGGDCGLALTKAAVGDLWTSGTKGESSNCFVRLGHNGEVTVVDDRYARLWSSNAMGDNEGEYVLVLQIDGQAAVYGPLTWSTAQYWV